MGHDIRGRCSEDFRPSSIRNECNADSERNSQDCNHSELYGILLKEVKGYNGADQKDSCDEYGEDIDCERYRFLVSTTKVTPSISR